MAHFVFCQNESLNRSKGSRLQICQSLANFCFLPTWSSGIDWTQSATAKLPLPYSKASGFRHAKKNNTSKGAWWTAATWKGNIPIQLILRTASGYFSTKNCIAEKYHCLCAEQYRSRQGLVISSNAVWVEDKKQCKGVSQVSVVVTWATSGFISHHHVKMDLVALARHAQWNGSMPWWNSILSSGKTENK